MPATLEAPSKTIKQLHRTANKYHKLRDDFRDTRTNIDLLVYEAKQQGATFREIAEACGLSVAWVQSALLRGAKEAEDGKPRA